MVGSFWRVSVRKYAVGGVEVLPAKGGQQGPLENSARRGSRLVRRHDAEQAKERLRKVNGESGENVGRKKSQGDDA